MASSNPRTAARQMVSARIKASIKRAADAIPELDTAPELAAQRREVAKLAKSNSPRKSRPLAIVAPVAEPTPDENIAADAAPEVVAAITAASVVQQPTNATRDELRRLHAAGGVGKAECARQVYGADATRSQLKQARRWLHQEPGSTEYTMPLWLRAQKSLK